MLIVPVPMSWWSFIRKTIFWLIVFFVLLIIGGLLLWYKWFAGPELPVVNEPRLQAAVVRLEGDKPLVQFISELKDMNVIKSDKVALSLIEHLGIGRKAKSGIYVFKGNEDVFTIISRISNGSYGYTPVKITIPEGYTVRKMADLYHEKLIDISEEDFIAQADQYEGFLFPDTYFFYPYATSGPAIAAMLNNFDKRVAPLKADFDAAAATGTASTSTYGSRDLKSIIIMASILEKEVQHPEDKAMVADLFYRRMKEGMALQADSTLTYATGKTSAQLTTKDLREKSPYNSYTNRGLPPTPISNPGLESIRAALYPTPNKYVYFLSDDEGTTHFSVTFEEHKKAKEKYLR